MIRYQAKTVVDALLLNCSNADAPRFAAELFRHYRHPEEKRKMPPSPFWTQC